MVARRNPRQPAVRDLALHPRMVRGQLLQHAVAKPVEPRVTDMTHDRLILDDQQRRHRRAQAAVIRAREGMREQCIIRRGKRPLETIPGARRSAFEHLLAQRPDRDPARDVTGRMTAHPVRNRKYPVLRRVQQCIFIAPPAMPEAFHLHRQAQAT